jgi:hypothetical protein
MKSKIKTIAVLGMFLLAGLFPFRVFADTLPLRSLELSTSYPSMTAVQYLLTFSTKVGYTIGSVKIEFCSNSPLVSLPCTPPVGMNATAAVIQSESGQVSFSIDGAQRAANSQVLVNATPFTSAGQISVMLAGIRNPDNLGTYYGRIQTFSSNDGTGTPIDWAGVTFNITQPLSISLEVPPYLYFCVAQTIQGYDCNTATSSFLDFGELSTKSTKNVTSQFVVATNGQYGVNINVSGTTLTSGNNTIPPLAGPTGSLVGTSQFGINVVSNSGFGSDPVGTGLANAMPGYNISNLFKFNSGDNIAFSSNTTAEKKFTVSYIANISKNQRPGVYSTTLIYTALASF